MRELRSGLKSFNLLCLVFFVLSGCATFSRVMDPQRGLYEALLRPSANWHEEAVRAERWHKEVLILYAPTENLAMQKTAEEIASRIANSARIPVSPKVTVLKGKEVNAFTLGGAYLYLFEALLDCAESEDELAFVIAHELAHCAAGHVGSSSFYAIKSALNPRMPDFRIEILEKEYEHKGKRYLSLSLDAPSPQDALATVLIMASAGYQRWEEREADVLGVYYMEKASYDPAKGIEILRRIGRREAELRRKAMEELEPLYLSLKEAFRDYERAKRSSDPLAAYAAYRKWLDVKHEYLRALYKWRDVATEVPLWFRSHPPVGERVGYLEEAINALRTRSTENVTTREVKYVFEDCWLIERGLPLPQK